MIDVDAEIGMFRSGGKRIHYEKRTVVSFPCVMQEEIEGHQGCQGVIQWRASPGAIDLRKVLSCVIAFELALDVFDCLLGSEG